MNQLAKDTLKLGISFFIIGVAVMLAAPHVVEFMPFEAETISNIKGSLPPPAWNGAVFGMFGALSAVVPPAVGKLLGLSKPMKAPEVAVAQGKGVSLELQPEQEIEHSPLDIEAEHEQQSFEAKILAEREQQPTSQLSI